MELRSRIRELIDKSGYKRKFIAAQLEISVKQLRNYETRHSLIPIDKAYMLADLLSTESNKVRVDDLYEKGNSNIKKDILREEENSNSNNGNT